jgi:hypothetical protein
MFWRYLSVGLVPLAFLMAPVVARDDARVVALQPGPTGGGVVLLADDFDGLAPGLLPESGPDPGLRLGYVAGEYVIQKDAGAAPFFNMLPGAFSNATLAIDARLEGSDAGQAVQVWCRSQREAPFGGYIAVLRPDIRSVRLGRVDSTGLALSDWRFSSAIVGGNDPNHVELTCAGSTISVAVNGVLVSTLDDGTYQAGSFSLSVGSQEDAADVRLDNLVITQR